MTPLLLTCLLASSGPLSVRLKDGNTVYLSCVTDNPKKDAWLPDGAPAPAFIHTWDMFPDGIAALKPTNGDIELIFVLRIPYPPADRKTNDKTWVWQPEVAEVDPAAAARYGVWFPPAHIDKTGWYCGRVLTPPENGKPFDLTVKVADTAWKTVMSARFRHGQRISGSKLFGSATHAKTMAKARGFPFDPPAKWLKYDWRVVFFDVMGTEMGQGPTIRIKGQPTLYTFGGTNDVGRVELEVRPYKTVHFKGIHPRPS